MSNSICEDFSHNNDDDHNFCTVPLFSSSSISLDNDISLRRITKNPACGSKQFDENIVCDVEIIPLTKFPRQGDLVHLLHRLQ